MSSSSRRPRAMTSTIPQDTIADILSRLPVKSLTRFKGVSRRWFHDLSSNPTFITTHLLRSAQNPSLVIRRYHVPTGFYSGIWVIRTPTEKTPFRIEDAEIPLLKTSVCYPRIVGSCNGLICLDVSPCYGSEFVLWNASIRQWERLPIPLIASSKDAPIWMVSLGFGYDCFENDYKIVRIVYFSDKNRSEDQNPLVKAEVFTWSLGFWREIEGLDRIESCIIGGGQNAVDVKGCLNWVATGLQDMSNRKFIISFDVNKEVARRIPLPAICRAGNVKIMSHKESLSFALYFGGNYASQFEIWVMNESVNDRGNWVKIFSTENLSRFVVPVGFWTWGDIEMIMKQIKGDITSLWSYDPRNGSARSLPVDGTDYTLEPCTYVESLVSVNGRSSPTFLQSNWETSSNGKASISCPLKT
ncbi:hypothetical protein SLA2020_468930 [Shorea laevis]